MAYRIRNARTAIKVQTDQSASFDFDAVDGGTIRKIFDLTVNLPVDTDVNAHVGHFYVVYIVIAPKYQWLLAGWRRPTGWHRR